MGRSPCINGKYNKPHQGLLSVQCLGIPYSVKHGRLSERGRLINLPKLRTLTAKEKKTPGGKADLIWNHIGFEVLHKS